MSEDMLWVGVEGTLLCEARFIGETKEIWVGEFVFLSNEALTAVTACVRRNTADREPAEHESAPSAASGEAAQQLRLAVQAYAPVWVFSGGNCLPGPSYAQQVGGLPEVLEPFPLFLDFLLMQALVILF